ncbi:hypothetical protein HOG21_06125 [bacterium]|jgi:hypothetical protein|nr:hypothetical protein [bacterium]
MLYNKEEAVIFIKPNFLHFQIKIIKILKKEFSVKNISQINNISEKLIFNLY